MFVRQPDFLDIIAKIPDGNFYVLDTHSFFPLHHLLDAFFPRIRIFRKREGIEIRFFNGDKTRVLTFSANKISVRDVTDSVSRVDFFPGTKIFSVNRSKSLEIKIVLILENFFRKSCFRPNPRSM